MSEVVARKSQYAQPVAEFFAKRAKALDVGLLVSSVRCDVGDERERASRRLAFGDWKSQERFVAHDAAVDVVKHAAQHRFKNPQRVSRRQRVRGDERRGLQRARVRASVRERAHDDVKEETTQNGG